MQKTKNAEKKQREPVHPGKVLLHDYLEPAKISQNQLAISMKVPPRRINEIVSGKRDIDADTALRLAGYFKTFPDLWLDLQKQYNDFKNIKQADNKNKVPTLQKAKTKEEIVKQNALLYKSKTDINELTEKANVYFEKILIELKQIIESYGNVKLVKSREYGHEIPEPQNVKMEPLQIEAYNLWLAINNTILKSLKLINSLKLEEKQKEGLKWLIKTSFLAGESKAQIDLSQFENFTVKGAKRVEQKEKLHERTFGTEQHRKQKFERIQKALDATYAKNQNLKSFEEIYETAEKNNKKIFRRPGTYNGPLGYSYDTIKKHCKNPRTKKYRKS